jgi:hypothetical protein
MSKLNKEELEYIRQAEADFKKKKGEISDLEIRKHYLIDEIKDIQRSFSGFEAELIKKYGEDSVIDMSTGEVKKK